jgi:tetratricopeptide (TPR) repeat protein
MCLGYLLDDPAARLASREEGLRLYQELEDAWGVALALWSLGQLRAQSGDLAAAEALCEQSLVANAAVGDRDNSANARTILAYVAVARGDATTARELLEQALRLHRELGDRRSSGMALARLGDLAYSVDDGAAAKDLYSQALPIFLDSGDSGMCALVLTGLASLALAADAPVQALHLASVASNTTSAPWVAGERWADVPGPLQIREAAARVLSQEAVIRAWAEGQAMTLDEAIAQALADDARV